jgi:hypothetical protein
MKRIDFRASCGQVIFSSETNISVAKQHILVYNDEAFHTRKEVARMSHRLEDETAESYSLSGALAAAAGKHFRFIGKRN